MKKFLRRLNRRKGFTLLECIIAIAVFAALTLVVMAMLTYARNEAVNANETEENLTVLIENVIGDDTQKKYYAGSDYLSLSVEGQTKPFDVSYNVIDGYKNYIECRHVDPVTGTACEYHNDNTEFMGDIKQEEFVQTNPFVCPKCGANNTIELQCQECLATGYHNNPIAFQYIPSTGGFYCMSCGSANVRDPKSMERVVDEELLSVNAMVANGVVYGKVAANVNDPGTPEDDRGKLIECYAMDASTLQTFTSPLTLSADSNIYFNISYTSNESQTIPGVYTMTVSKPTVKMEVGGTETTLDTFCLRVKMPPYYKIIGLKEISGGGVIGPNIVCSEADDAPMGKDGYIDFKFEAASSSLQAQFQLVNYKSGHSFDYDYAAESLFDAGAAANLDGHGLAGHWFGATVTPNGITVTKNQHPTSVASSVAITKPEGE